MKITVTLELDVEGDDATSLFKIPLWQKSVGVFPPQIDVKGVHVVRSNDSRDLLIPSIKKKVAKKAAKKKTTRRR